MDSISSVLDHALSYITADLSVIPIRRDGSKSAAIDWGEFGKGRVDKQSGELLSAPRLMTEPEVRRYFSGQNPPGIALACGAVSGHLEVIDFDVKAETNLPVFYWLVECEFSGLVERLTQVKTPRDEYSRHFWYRCSEASVHGNDKLARAIIDGKSETMIETRGEGGYALVPGSPRECHPAGRLYVHVAGPPLTQLANISAKERDCLLRACRSLDASQKDSNEPADTETLLPGTDFNQRGPDFADLLEPFGWVCARRVGSGIYWRRPGKEVGWSATSGICTSKNKVPLFAVFSSNAHPFESGQNGKVCSCYSKFGVYALLTHNGDFKAAARALMNEGYGKPRDIVVVSDVAKQLKTQEEELEAQKKRLEELTSKVKEAKEQVKEAEKEKKKEEKEEQDKKIRIGFTALGFEFSNGEWEPGGWSLNIIHSEPITYRLLPPFMDKAGVILNGPEFDSPIAVHRAVLLATGNICLADRPQAWDMLWNGYKNYRAMKAKLLDVAGHEDAPIEIRRSCVVALWLLRRLNHGRLVKDKSVIDGSAGIYKLEDGSVVFDFTYVWTDGSKSEDQIKRPEFSRLLNELNRGEYWKGKKLYNVLTKKSLEQLETKVRPNSNITDSL
jgi:hypothetical protein